jgi:hypothetical protein
MDNQGGSQQYGYDPRSNGLSRRPTDEAQLSSHNPAANNRTEYPIRTNTDPDQQDRPKAKRSGKICGKCGEGLTGQFVRALGDTYHLECFTCHVRLHRAFFNIVLLLGWLPFYLLEQLHFSSSATHRQHMCTTSKTTDDKIGLRQNRRLQILPRSRETTWPVSVM